MYLVVSITSFMYIGTLELPHITSLIIRLFALVVFVLSVIGMVKVHSMYPEKHDKPSDFPKLLKGDPYSIIRHPLYALAIVNQLSIPILFLSLQGLITFIICLPLWYVLIKIEEKELIEYWGGEYLRYMKDQPSYHYLIGRVGKRVELF